MEKKATRRHPAAPVGPSRLKHLENQLANAEIEKHEALRFFEQARHYLMLCTRQVQDIKAEIKYGKEACHE